MMQVFNFWKDPDFVDFIFNKKIQMEEDLEPPSEDASDGEVDEDNDDYETMTVTDVGDNFNEQVWVGQSNGSLTG